MTDIVKEPRTQKRERSTGSESVNDDTSGLSEEELFPKDQYEFCVSSRMRRNSIPMADRVPMLPRESTLPMSRSANIPLTADSGPSLPPFTLPDATSGSNKATRQLTSFGETSRVPASLPRRRRLGHMRFISKSEESLDTILRDSPAVALPKVNSSKLNSSARYGRRPRKSKRVTFGHIEPRQNDEDYIAIVTQSNMTGVRLPAIANGNTELVANSKNFTYGVEDTNTVSRQPAADSLGIPSQEFSTTLNHTWSSLQHIPEEMERDGDRWRPSTSNRRNTLDNPIRPVLRKSKTSISFDQDEGRRTRRGSVSLLNIAESSSGIQRVKYLNKLINASMKDLKAKDQNVKPKDTQPEVETFSPKSESPRIESAEKGEYSPLPIHPGAEDLERVKGLRYLRLPTYITDDGLDEEKSLKFNF